MGSGEKQDNSTFKQKAALRREMLKRLPDEPVVMETHGGLGQVWREVYSQCGPGAVIEKDEMRTPVLAKQRPDWAVYEGKAEALLAEGVGAHLPVNVLDVDPYGDPWPTITAFFDSVYLRWRPDALAIVVNDGLRKKAQAGGNWSSKTLGPVVEKLGNDLFPIYLDVCKILMSEKAGAAGYELVNWAGYYCGAANDTTHYLAILENVE